MVDLVRMTEGEFESYNHPLIEDYASDLARNFKKPIEKMQDIVKNQLGSLLRDGVDTKDHFLFNILDDAEKVGTLWIQVKDGGGKGVPLRYKDL